MFKHLVDFVHVGEWRGAAGEAARMPKYTCVSSHFGSIHVLCVL